MNRISLCLFMAIKFVYFVLCHLGWGRVWTWVYDPPVTFTILSGRWVGDTGCPAKSSAKGGHPTQTQLTMENIHHYYWYNVFSSLHVITKILMTHPGLQIHLKLSPSTRHELCSPHFDRPLLHGSSSIMKENQNREMLILHVDRHYEIWGAWGIKSHQMVKIF
jgi:hypothetical protein